YDGQSHCEGSGKGGLIGKSSPNLTTGLLRTAILCWDFLLANATNSHGAGQTVSVRRRSQRRIARVSALHDARPLTTALLEAHRLAEFAPHFLGLSVVPAEIVEQIFPERMNPVLRERHALGVELAPDVGKRDVHVARGVADHALRIGAAGDRVEVAEQLPAQERDAAVARAEILPGAVGDAPLADPGDDVLVDDVAGDPAPARVLDRAGP